jgi:conjugal transfer pilus assembly protein TraF
MAARFGITITPTLIMIQKGNQDFIPISAGVVTAEELEDRTYRTVRLMRGDTSPDQYSMHEFQRGGGFDTAPPDSSSTQYQE